MIKSAAKKRWAKISSTAEILIETKNLQISPFGKTSEGLQDFRGIQLSTTELSSGGGWKNNAYRIDISRSDFSFSSWKGFDIANSKVSDCRFDDAEFVGDIRFFAVYFDTCRFGNSLFKNVNFTNSSLNSVSFEGLKSRDKISFNAERIKDCNFEGEMKGISFAASPISNSSFAGTLTDCTFFGNPTIVVLDQANEVYGRLAESEVRNRMDGVSFENAALVRCHVSNYCYLDKVRPPPTESNCIVKINLDFFDAAKYLMMKHCASEISGRAIMWLETFYKPDPRIPYGIAGPHDLEKPLGLKGANDFYKALLEAATKTKTKV